MQSVIVTGGSGGIGQAICRILAREGYAVANFDPVGADVLARDLPAGSYAHFRVDVGNRSQVEEAVDRVEREVGPLWGLVNCAGIAREVPFLETGDDLYERYLHVNVKGIFVCSQIVARRMLPRRQGRIVNICSTSSWLGFAGLALYDATKGAARQFTRTMAVELGPHGIQVNGVAPGTIETPQSVNWRAMGQVARHDLERTPMGRFGQPEDIGEAVAFLVSPQATWINGAILVVDGGYCATGMPVFSDLTQAQKG